MLSLALHALLAFQGDAPVKPAKALDPKDPQSILDHAIYNTRTQKSYETSYKSRLTDSSGTLDYEGRSVWVSPDVLYVHTKGSGQDDKKIVRAGDHDIWLHHPLANEWLTAAQSADPGAGRGIQNPDEVLSVMAKHTATAKLLKPGLVEITLTGDALQNILKNQLQNRAINPKDSGAKLQILVDADQRIRKFTCDASVAFVGADVARYSSEVMVVTYNEVAELKFADEKGRPIPLHPEMKEKIEALLKKGK